MATDVCGIRIQLDLQWRERRGHFDARIDVVPREEVLYFASEGGLTRLQSKVRAYWMQPTLQDLESSLDPAHFCRISRATIVNLDAVGEVAPMPGGHGEVRLANGAHLEVSRRRFKSLMDRLARL